MGSAIVVIIVELAALEPEKNKKEGPTIGPFPPPPPPPLGGETIGAVTVIGEEKIEERLNASVRVREML